MLSLWLKFISFFNLLKSLQYVKGSFIDDYQELQHKSNNRKINEKIHLHNQFREFLRAGSDVMQAFTFYASEDKLINRGNMAGQKIGVEAINRY